MSEIVADLEYRLVDQAGREYFVNVAAEPGADGVWDAWLEFVPLDDSDPLLTGTETHRSTRADVVLWASTLTDVGIQGAFERARPAGSDGLREMVTPFQAAALLGTEAVLDPFEVFALGKDVLRAQLRPLRRVDLLTIIQVYDLNPAQLSLARLSDRQLVTFIVTATEVQIDQIEQGRS